MPSGMVGMGTAGLTRYNSAGSRHRGRMNGRRGRTCVLSGDSEQLVRLRIEVRRMK